MYKSGLHKIIIAVSVLFCLFSFVGCSQPQIQETVQQQQQGGFIKIAPGAYDSADTAIVVAKQEKQNKITFLNLEKKKNYTLSYDGTTKFLDKYGTPISVSQLQEGEMVDIQFLRDEKLLSSLEISSEIWTYQDVSKFELDLAAGRMKIMDEYYTLEDTTVVLSGGEQVEFLDIHEEDILQVKGRDHKIHSITIQEGHGYLRLENDEYFVGGWIEVGQKIIQKIEEDMLLVVPEGSYDVYLSHNGIEGTKKVEIKRGKEFQLDVSDLKKEDLVKYGNLIVTVDPADAVVSIDGKVVDTGRVIKATYGLHQVMAKADGYDTLTQYIRVTEKSANIAISLDEETVRTVSENSVNSGTNNTSTNQTDVNTGNSANNNTNNTSNKNGSSVSENDTGSKTTDKNSANSTVSGNVASDQNNADDVSTTGYKVTIEAPTGAEVYVDGNYVGIVPASFSKKPGNHEITIRKSGYLTRTYTIDVDDENQDISYSFSDLKPIEQ